MNEKKNKKLDESFIQKQAEKVTESDIQDIVNRSEEIEHKFLGNGPLGEFVEEALLALALVKDYAIGRYRKIPYWAIGALVFMYMYVFSPIDIIPDYIIGIGQIDDLAVVALCLTMVRQEVHHYKLWREAHVEDED